MGTDVRVLSVTKMKDAPTPEPMGFGLEEVTLPWRDTEGNPETSVVLVPTGTAVAPKKARAAKRDNPTKHQRLAFQALLEALEAHGVAPPWPARPDEPHPDRVVRLEDWRAAFYDRHTGDNQDAKKKAFQRVRQDLTDSNVRAVQVRNDYYWPTPELSPWEEFSALMGTDGLLKRKL
jgi:hypothetical protein